MLGSKHASDVPRIRSGRRSHVSSRYRRHRSPAGPQGERHPPRPARRPARRRRRRSAPSPSPPPREPFARRKGACRTSRTPSPPGFPVFTFDAPRRRTLVTIPAGGFYAQEWTFGEHSGTHMDAPGHFVSGGRLSPEITPQELIVPIVVIDIAARAASEPRRDGHCRRPDSLRAAPRPHPGGVARLHGLGLGGQGRRSHRLQGRRPPSPATTSPASASRRRCGSPRSAT